MSKLKLEGVHTNDFGSKPEVDSDSENETIQPVVDVDPQIEPVVSPKEDKNQSSKALYNKIDELQEQVTKLTQAIRIVTNNTALQGERIDKVHGVIVDKFSKPLASGLANFYKQLRPTFDTEAQFQKWCMPIFDELAECVDLKFKVPRKDDVFDPHYMTVAYGSQQGSPINLLVSEVRSPGVFYDGKIVVYAKVLLTLATTEIEKNKECYK